MSIEKTLYVRGDGGAGIGAGHLMRLMTITDNIRKQCKIIYLCADEASALLPRDKGYEVIVLGTDYQDMEEEIPLFSKLFSEKAVFLVDSYYVTEAYLMALRNFGSVYLMDDYGAKAYPVDGVINYNAFASKARYEELYPMGKSYVGPSYVPLRDQFSVEYTQKKDEKAVLITTGGGDKDNIAGQILEAIYEKDKNYHLIVGLFSPNYEKIKAYAEDKQNVILHHNVENMAELMQGCRFGITAGGTTIYEMCAAKLPFVCFSYAENQRLLTEYVGENKIGFFAGSFEDDKKQVLSNIREAVNIAFKDEKRIRTYAEEGKKLVDGMGASRLGEAILQELI